MGAIYEKGNNGLFNNEVEFSGKYANYIRVIKEQTAIPNKDLYVIAAIVGFMNNRTETEDNSEKVQTSSIFPNENGSRRADLRFVYRLIMLLKKEEGFALDDYSDRAFKDDIETHADVYKENMRIFNDYVCGGVEYLYELLENESSTDEIVDKVYGFLHELSVDVGIGDEEELDDFSPKFSSELFS